VLHQVGAGTLGPVFRAYEPDRDRLVAIKLFRLDLPPERVHQLVGEFEQLIGAGLDHGVIAAPLAAGIEGVTAYLAQDYVTAESLDIVIREGGPASVSDAVGVASRLAEALDYAADRRIVHGTLHPRDVLLSSDDFRVTGLGLARALERVGVNPPVRRPYTAPERVGGGAWDRRADIFSLAAVMHELIWGRRLAGTGAQAAAGITETGGGDPVALRDVFVRALADDMADRFSTATEFTNALAAAFEGRPAKVSRMVRRAPRLSAEPRLPLEGRDAGDVSLFSTEPSPDRELEIEAAVKDVRDSDSLETPVEARVRPEPEEPITRLLRAEHYEPEKPLELGEPLRLVESAERFERFETVESGGPMTHIDRADHVADIDDVDDVDRVDHVDIDHRDQSDHEDTLAPVEMRPGSLLSSEPVSEPSSLSLVWPLVLAGVVGVALGFGAGYAVAIRDRPVTALTSVNPIDQSGDAARNTSQPAANAAAPGPTGAITSRALPPPLETSRPVAPANVPAPTPGVPAPAPRATAPVAPLFAGRVLVRSTPPGARVFVDGHGGGETPTTVRDLARGSHQVRLVREGYTTVERRITITAAEPSQTLTVAMTKTPPPAPVKTEAPLVIESKPSGASVFLDGRQVGTTPLTFPLVQIGTHAVRITLDGYRPWTSPVQVSATETNRVTASLER
jgi:hypothetical protein